MTEPYAVPVPRGYRVGVWEVHAPIATGAFGSVYAARRTGGDDTKASPTRPGGDDNTKAPPTRPGGDGTGHRPSRPGTTDTAGTDDSHGTGTGTGTHNPSRAQTGTAHPDEGDTDVPGHTSGNGTTGTDGTRRSHGTGTGTPSRAHTDTAHPAEGDTDNPGHTSGNGTTGTDGTGRSHGTGTGTGTHNPSRVQTGAAHPSEGDTDNPGRTGGDGTARRPGRAGVVGAGRGGDAGGEVPDTVALKFLPTGTGTPRQLAHLRDLVEREVELLRRLRRPRLIRMYETLTVDDPAHPRLDGATVLVLERAEGSLSALLAATPRPPAGPALLAQVCEGLHQLHRAGWVHGDLKPANVLLMADGSARLADFNMAAELEGTHAYTPAFSTPDYTPPELLWSEIGERGRRIRPSADVWAFGVLAHLVLTGSFPLPGGTPTARRDAAVAYARGGHELRLSPELPPGWREIVRACLTRTHADRIGTDALLRRVTGTTEGASGGAGFSPRTRARPRRRVLAALAAGLLALAALGYGVARWAGDGREPAAGPRPGGTGSVAAASYGAAELRTDRDVPPAYRLLIVETAHDCDREEVSPALIAAMLKVESDFDPDLADPARDEYGIARWTPSVLRWWMNEDGTPGETVPQPPFPPAESVPAMGRYLCWIAPRLDAGLPGDRSVLVAVAYRTSYRKVNDAGGVPPKYRDYADRVAHHLKEYTPRRGK
ncbi:MULTISPECIES: serine/threonine protein kinase [unclassified Streptomyces]|uniref:serine/threonine protein kinase n=1 Tax=unclassified Streptomyces TaxID=2593676 RepID=UPI00087DBF3C|nr:MULTISPECIES: protein kinase [unclassified Streptomyces]REH23061.1 serine/threonine protein kinase [Streptomyces sp. 2221.1]SDT72492.1 serine/threonine protein kinase [Streptomyces sp. 2114.2]